MGRGKARKENKPRIGEKGNGKKSWKNRNNTLRKEEIWNTRVKEENGKRKDERMVV